MIDKNYELDNLSPNGIYAVPDEANEPRLTVREMYNYCRKHGKNPEELTQKERESFLVNDES